MNEPVSLLRNDSEADQDIFDSITKKGYKLNSTSLLEALQDAKNNQEIKDVIVALGYEGDDSVVQILKEFLNHKNEDVRSVAVLAIAKIAGNKETELFAELLAGNFEPKMYPMAALWEVGDATALVEVREIANKLVHGDMKYIDWTNDPLYVVEYINKHAQGDEDLALAKKLCDEFESRNSNFLAKFIKKFKR